MKPRQLATIIALLSLTQNMAHATVIVDLPDPSSDDFNGSDLPLPDSSPAPIQTEYVGNLSLDSLTRKSGGDLYAVELQRPIHISRLELKVTANRLKIHLAALITESGARIDVRDFKNSEVIGTHKTITSEKLNVDERVQSIEFYFESYSGNANASLKVISADDVAKLTLTQKPVADTPTAPAVKPATPPPPPPPRGSEGQTRPTPPPAPSRPIGACAGEICVNETVVYNNTTSVTVVRINNRNSIAVRFSDGGIYDVSISTLSKPISCLAHVCAGDQKMYNYRNPVRVISVFRNNMALVMFPDRSEYNIPISSLTNPIKCLEGICADDLLMYNYSSPVQVISVFSNRTASVKFSDGSVHDVGLTTLSKKTTCLSGVCAGDRRMYNYSNPVTVLAVFGNNTASVRFSDGGIYTVGISTLTAAIKCLNGLCEGDSVMYGYTNEVKVLQVYSNNTASVRFADGQIATVGITQLTGKVSCQKNICVGNKLMYNYREDVTVLAVFTNNQARVRFSSNNETYDVPLSYLSGKINCLQGFCKGDKVLFGANNTGRIEQVFGNNTARVKTVDGTYDFNLSQLRKMR